MTAEQQAAVLGRLIAVVFDLQETLTVAERLARVEAILRDAGLEPPR